MININNYKDFKEDKEIMDIIADYNEVELLLENRNVKKLKEKLQEMSSKYILEKIAYNSVNVIPPQNEYQSASNCMKFLFTLLNEKILKKSCDNH